MRSDLPVHILVAKLRAMPASGLPYDVVGRFDRWCEIVASWRQENVQMAVSRRSPKTLRIDDLRQHLGDEAVEKLIREIKGGPGRRSVGAAKVTREQLDRTLALVNGQAVGDARRAWIGTVPVFRLYFSESAQRRRFLNEWAQKLRDSLPEQAPRRPGRPRGNGVVEA